MLRGLCADPNNVVFIISGRARQELSEWFGSIVSLLCCGWWCACHASPSPARQELLDWICDSELAWQLLPQSAQYAWAGS